MRFLTSLDRGLPVSLAVPVSPSMPSSEPERSAEAARRALPELLKLDRYERRAVARRDRAIRHLIANRPSRNQKLCNGKNEAIFYSFFQLLSRRKKPRLKLG